MSTPTPPDLRRPGPAPQPFGPTLPRRWWAWPTAIVTGCAVAFAAFLASLAGEALPYTQDLTPNCASLGPPHPGASAPPSLPALPSQTVLATAQGFDLGPPFTAPRPNGTTYVFTAVPETRLEIVQAQVTQALQRTGHRVTIDEQARQHPTHRVGTRSSNAGPCSASPATAKEPSPSAADAPPRRPSTHHPRLAPLPAPRSRPRPSIYCSAAAGPQPGSGRRSAGS